MSTLILPCPSTHPDLYHGKYVAGLFANGEQGVWYDPSDFSTMFQDAAGTTPVTAVEQPVGLILDKSKGLVLGPELVTNGDFSNGTTGWTGTRSNLSVSSGALVVGGTGAFPGAWQAFSTTSGRLYKITFEIVSMGTATTVRFSPKNGTGDAGTALAIIDFTTTGTKTAYFFATSSTSTVFVLAENNAVVNFTIDNISVRELPGNHATQATVPKRPILKIDGNGKYYLKFDGIDDAMQTASVNFTGTDKVTVWAGVRKLSGVFNQIIAELSLTSFSTDGTFSLRGPTSTIDSYDFTSRGTVFASAQISGYPSPHTSVLTGIGNISGDSSVLKINGVQVASTTLDQGTGNYGNYPLYIGSRGGTTLPFNGHLYSLIIRGAQSSEAQILSAETYCNQKTGAY